MSTVEYDARLARRLALDTPERLDGLTRALREMHERADPLPADHPRIPMLRALDAGFWAGVAVQERITGLPYPDCFAIPPAAAPPTPLQPHPEPVERPRRRSA